MTQRIYVSTGCLRKQAPLLDRIRLYYQHGLENIELGAAVEVDEYDLVTLSEETGSFLVHNYFPPPDEPFVLNLASEDPEIRRRSLGLTERAMDLCTRLGAPFYSVHAGFVTDPGEFDGVSFVFPEPKEVDAGEHAMARFIDSIMQVVSGAERRGLRLMIENNVCPPHLVDKLLLQTPTEFKRFFDRYDGPPVEILLDTGHLNVSANTLGFDRMDFLRLVGQKIGAIHLHDNDGTADRHRPAEPGSWAVDVVGHVQRAGNVPVVVEAIFEGVGALENYVRDLGNYLNRKVTGTQ